MNDLIPQNLPSFLVAVFCLLPLLSAYALWRMRESAGPDWLRWNKVAPLPFTVFEMLIILPLVVLAMQIPGVYLCLPLISFACAAIFTRAHGIDLTAQWGLYFQSFPRYFRCSFNTYFAVFLPVFAATLVSLLLCQQFGVPDLMQAPVKEFLESGDAGQVIKIFVLATLFAPLWEEMVFRGIVYPWLKSKMPQNAAILISALFFASIHHHLPTFLPLAVLGVALALVYEYTGSLLSSIVLHALFNFATCLNLLLMRQS